MDSIMQNLKRATVDIILLSLLEEKDKYAYQMAMELKEKTGNAYTIKEGSMYPILTRLKTKGFITYEEVIHCEKMRRVYYHLTETGHAYLAERKATLKENLKVIYSLIDLD